MPKVQKGRALSFYVAGKVNKEESTIQDLISLIKRCGHTISFDWTTFPVERPFVEHQKGAGQAAARMLLGVTSADVVIVIPDQKGVGLFIEAGAALATSEGKRIYVVGEQNARSTFYFHPAMKRIENIAEMKKIIKGLPRP